MNSALQLANHHSPDEAPPTAGPTELPNPQPASPPGKPPRRARSKIARLPKTARDQLNTLIEDGVPFADIPARLGDIANIITPRDISRWAQSPHFQRWVLDQEWLEKLRADQEPALDLLDGFDNSRFDQATLQLAVARLFFALRHADSGDLNQHLGGNAQTFARLVHALSRACHEFAHVQKCAEAAAIAQALQLQPKDPERNFSDNELRLVIDKWDQVFKRSRNPALHSPSGGGSALHSATEGGPGSARSTDGGPVRHSASDGGPEPAAAPPPPAAANVS
jgi:hypothetical protein